MQKYLELGDISQMMVKRADGSVWLAEYDTAGRITPVRQLEAPEKKEEYHHGGSGSCSSTKLSADPIGTSLKDVSLKDVTDSLSQIAKAVKDGLLGGVEGINKSMDGSKGSVPQNQALATDLRLPKMDDGVFRARLSSIMTDNKYDRRVRGRTLGKVDMTRLPKVMTRSQSVFTQKMARKNKKYNVVLVVDESGSMDGAKINRAADVAVFLAKHFEGLNLDLKIVGFNHYIYTHKEFGTKVVNYDNLKTSMLQRMCVGAGCNHDFDALSYAYKSLVGMQGQNFVIFISDGAPATCRRLNSFIEGTDEYEPDIEKKMRDDVDTDFLESEFKYRTSDGKIVEEQYQLWYDKGSTLNAYERDEMKHLNHLVKANENLATTIGVGIMSTCWQVPDNFSVDSVDDMKPKILEAIKRKVKRG